MESFLRGNLQVQFGGRRASTLPYEYSDYNSSDEQSLTFDSYTIPEDDLELGQSRLLEVDNRVVLPAKSHIRFIVTSADVPHSWAVPSSGVKCDAVPGRLSISYQEGLGPGSGAPSGFNPPAPLPPLARRLFCHQCASGIFLHGGNYPFQ